MYQMVQGLLFVEPITAQTIKYEAASVQNRTHLAVGREFDTVRS